MLITITCILTCVIDVIGIAITSALGYACYKKSKLLKGLK